jgi:hypothetical protein
MVGAAAIVANASGAQSPETWTLRVRQPVTGMAQREDQVLQARRCC